MDPELVPIRSGSVFTDGMQPGAVPVNFVSPGAPMSAVAAGGVVPPASEMSVMRTQMVVQQPPSQTLSPPNGARPAPVDTIDAAIGQVMNPPLDNPESLAWLPWAAAAWFAWKLLSRKK